MSHYHQQQEPGAKIECSLDDLRTVTREVVEQTLTSIGVDLANPIQMQQDFAQLREWRLAMASIRNKGMLVIASLLFSGLLAALVVGIKTQLRSLLHP